MNNDLHATVNNINRCLKPARNTLKFIHLNARSVPGHFDEIAYVIANTDFDIIGISETWFKKSTPKALSNIPGYNLVRCDRKTTSTRSIANINSNSPTIRGGGVAFYINKKYKYSILETSEEDEKVEFVLVELRMCGGKFLIGCFYNPPPSSERDCEFISSKIEQYICSYNCMVIMGDFNCNLLERNSLKQKLNSLSLAHVNKNPTRENSLLDLLIVPESDLNRILSHGQSSIAGLDHDAIFMTYKYRRNRSPTKYAKKPDFSSINMNALLHDAYHAEWNAIYNMTDPNLQATHITKIINDLYAKHVKLKKYMVRKAESPWMTPVIISKLNARDEAYKVWKQNRNPIDRQIFCNLRNSANFAVRDAKKSYLRNILNPSLPSKKLWKNIKNVGLLTAPNEILNGKYNSDEFNKHFTDQISASVTLPLPEPNFRSPENFSFQHVLENQVMQAFKSITSNAVGSDNISLRFIKIIIIAILPFITYFINHCITTSTFPDCWKCAIVLPIAKKDDANCLSDYRPISILPVLSKLFEQLLKSQMVAYLQHNKLLSNKQSGFRRGHSTTTALLKITNDISTQLDRSKFTILSLLDFSKAFDSINHDCLLQKLYLNFSFSFPAIKLIRSYLTDRTQIVRINDESSASAPICCGVPQGSVLGPLLFCLYINDLAESLAFCLFHLYADDCPVYLSDEFTNMSVAFQRFNYDLNQIYMWSVANGLMLNASKTKILFISNASSSELILPELIINGVKLEVVGKVKNLGLILNSNLSWSDHIAEISRKIHFSLFTLRATSCFTPVSLRLKLVRALLIPIFTYCDIIFYNSDSDSKRKLNVAFNSCLRYIYGLRRFDHISSYRDSILGCPLRTYYTYRVACFIYDLLKSETPEYLFTEISYGNSRRTGNLRFPTHRTLLRSRSFFIHGISFIWNKIPRNIRSISSTVQFRELCFNYINKFT